MKKIIVVCIILLLISALLNGKMFPLRSKNYQRSYRPVDAVVGIRLTHPSYQPLDQNGKPIDIDAVLVSKLNIIENHYAERTAAMARTLSRQYFTALAHRHGLKLKLIFSD